MAAGEKTGGRKKGTPNKRTAALQQAAVKTAKKVRAALGAAAFDGDAHALLMTVYRDIDTPLDLRVEAAGKAIPYEKPKLSSVTVKGDKDAPIAIELDLTRLSTEQLKELNALYALATPAVGQA